MNQTELNEARTNPEFLKFLEEQESKAINEKSISELYQVLDTLLVLNLDEDRIHKVYQEILKISFERIEARLAEGAKLSIENDDIYFIRSFYEHAIEKWSVENYQGAKELFFVLSQIVEDELLVDSFAIHLLQCDNEIDMDRFYEKSVAPIDNMDDEKYGYFITKFNFDTKEYLDSNTPKLQEQYQQMKHLLN